MRGRLAAVAGAALLLLLTGCASPIAEGYITEKNYKEAYSTTTLYCSMYGKYGCTLWQNQTNYYPESWWFSIVESGDRVEKGEPKTGWVYVGPETFDSYEVGDYYEPVKPSEGTQPEG